MLGVWKPIKQLGGPALCYAKLDEGTDGDVFSRPFQTMTL